MKSLPFKAYDNTNDNLVLKKINSKKEFQKLINRTTNFLGGIEISEIESICEEMQEYIREICSSFQNAISDDVIDVETFNETMEALEEIKGNILTQKFLIKSMSRQ